MLAALALLGLAGPARAQADDFDATEEVVVWGDLFARWDDTRWMITTEIGYPRPVRLARDDNDEFNAVALQLRTVLACDKDWKLGRKKYEVSCTIEDIGLLAAASTRARTLSDNRIEIANRVLNEIDAKLTGAELQLQVAADGRVTNLDLEGVPKRNRRQSEALETLRQVLSRVAVGFHLKMQKNNQLHEGKWHEYNSTLLQLPNLETGRNIGNPGSSLVVHYLNRYRGHVLVQSIGKGTTRLNPEQGVQTDQYITTELIGVSIFDDEDGFMTERVWAVNGQSTAGTLFNTFTYFHGGRIRMLGEDDRPDVGPTKLVNGPEQSRMGLDDWIPLEKP